MIARHMLADCYRVIFLNTVRFSLILHFRKMGVVSRNMERMGESKNQIKYIFLRASFLLSAFFLCLVSIKRTNHANQRNTGTTLYRVGKLFICLTHFRKNPLINESFPGDSHFLVFCIQRIILLSLVIFVDHDWNGSVGVFWLDSITLPVCPGLR